MSIRELQVDQSPIEVQQLKARMLQIQDQLVLKTPELPIALADIHKNLLQHEELIHLLDDDDIRLLHQTHELHKQFAMIQKEAKSVSGRRKKLNDNDLANL